MTSHSRWPRYCRHFVGITRHIYYTVLTSLTRNALIIIIIIIIIGLLHAEMVYPPEDGRSPIQVLTGPDVR